MAGAGPANGLSVTQTAIDLARPHPGHHLQIPGFLLDAQRRALELVVKGAPLSEILTYLTQIVEDHADGTVVAAILLLDSHGKLQTGAAPSLPAEYNAAIDGLTAEIGVGTCSEAAVSQEIVITPDIAQDPNWRTIKHLPLGLGLKAAWSHPVVSGSGKTLATFGTYFREKRGPSPTERQLIAVLAPTAALAIERKQTEEAREQQQRVLHCVIEAADMGTWRYSFADEICEYSPRAQELYGVGERRWLHNERGVTSIFHPDDVAPMWRKVEEACDPNGNGRYGIEYRVRKPGGGWRWLSARAVVEYETAAGSKKPVALVGASRDITDIKEAEARQELLVRELNHRVKNTLAVIQAIVAQMLREKPDLATFKDAFFDRLAALSRTHSLLCEDMWAQASVGRVAEAMLEPFRIEGRTSFGGPAVAIDANRAVALCLLLHELATNAAKHGALANEVGFVDLRWSVVPGARGDHVTLCWQESGSGAAEVPGPLGFGSRLLKASAGQLGGDIRTVFKDGGMRCELTFPVDEEAVA